MKPRRTLSMGGIVPRTPAGDNDCGLASYHPMMRLLVRLIGCMLLSLAAKAQAADQPPLVVYDLTHTANAGADPAAHRAWDEQHLVAALQGLANRDSAQLYVLFVGEHGKTDQYWLDKLRGSGVDGGQWLADRPIAKARDVADLLRQFKSTYRGVVVYDEHVPETAAIASTVAGADDLLPIRFDDSPGSLYHQLVLDLAGPRLDVKARLINADGTPMFTGKITGSVKCDALLWAVDHYLKTGKCDPTRLAYYPDAYWLDHAMNVPAEGTLLCNHDFFISRRAFFFDLNVWEDESARTIRSSRWGWICKRCERFWGCPRPGKGQDHRRRRLHAVGSEVHQSHRRQTRRRRHGMALCGDPLEFRRLHGRRRPRLERDGQRIGVPTFPAERPYPRKTFPPKTTCAPRPYRSRRKSRPEKLREHLRRRLRLGRLAVSDDAQDLGRSHRGSVPLGWAFDPEIADRFPVGLHYARTTATANDTFISGDSGYGYLNPGGLVPPRKWSDLPSGLPAWESAVPKRIADGICG